MPTINRKKLSRGIKLTTAHVNSLAQNIETVLSGSTNGYGFGREHIKTNFSHFHMDWYIPTIRSSWGDSAALQHPIMWTLPPLQDEFNEDYIPKQLGFSVIGFDAVNTTNVMDALMISWDQASNPVAITDTYDTLSPGLLTDSADSYSFILKLYEKTPQRIDADVQGPDALIYSTDIRGISVSATGFRANPFEITDINIPIHPYKTYTWTLTFTDDTGLSPTVGGAARSISLPNFHIKARFKTPLKYPDVFDQADPALALYSNFPSASHFYPALSIVTASVGSTITADTLSSGSSINANYSQFDRLAVNGYMGGLTAKSDTFPNKTIRDEYTYDVIVVPLFCGADQIRRKTYQDADPNYMNMMPFQVAPLDPAHPEYVRRMMDRRVIHLPYPFIVHHVYCHVSHYAPELQNNIINVGTPPLPLAATTGKYPGAEITRKVGVTIGTGLRADNYDYQQVAYGEMFGFGVTNQWVDRIQIQDENGNPESWGSVNTGGDRNNAYDAELWGVPLVGATNRTGKDYYPTGYPFFCGQGNKRTMTRTETYDYPYAYQPAPQTSHTPYTQGAEQWIEVRGLIEDLNGFNDPLQDPRDIILGTTGWYIYLIGKRPITK